MTSAGRALALTSLFLVACNSDEKPTSSSTGPGTLKPQDWTMLGYDLGSTYFNKAETKISVANAAQLVKAWEFDTHAGATATPVISGGRVYVSSNPGPNPDNPDEIVGGLIAIDIATGVDAWRNTEAGGVSSLALDQNVLYMHDASGTIRAFDVANGHQRWFYRPDEHPNVGGFSSPIVTKDLVLVGGSGLEEVALAGGTPATFRGFIAAVHKSDGTLVYKKYTVEPPATGVGIWSTLSADEADGIVIGATGNNYTGEATDTSDAFLALPLADGADFRWKAQILKGDVYTTQRSNGNPDGDFGANPILFEVDGRKLAAGGAKMGDVFVVDRTTGEILKQRNIGPPSAFKGGVFNNGAWDGSSLLLLCNGSVSADPRTEPGSNAVLFALDPLTLNVKWERGVVGPAYSPISVANGVGFFGKNMVLQAFDTATGDVLFEFPTEATISTAPAVSDGYVVFGSGMPWIQSTNGSKYYALKVP